MKTIEANKEINTGNLYSFYLGIANRCGYNSGNVSSARYVLNETMSWPSYVLGGGKMAKVTLLEIFGRMKDGTLPCFWLRSVEDDPEFEDFALNNGIRRINYWRGMNLSRESPFKLPVPFPGLIFEEIKTHQDLKEWLQVVNLEIMSHRELDIYGFKNIMNDSAFRFFRVSQRRKTISTILMHKRNTEVGIYMVSTVLTERGRGIGRWITASAIDLFIGEGCKEFVLHATPLGYPVYLKLGFEECCEYGIFWLLGKK